MPSRVAALHRRITAYHEAAHAVIAFRFGIPIHEIALCRTGPLQGYVRFFGAANESNTASAKNYLSDLEWSLFVRRAEQEIMVLMAGALAEARLLNSKLRAHGCMSDLSRSMGACYMIDDYRRHLVQTHAKVISVEQPIDMANRLRRRTRQILAHPNTWRAVSALAEDVEAWSVLSGHEAADTVQWSQRIQNQLGLHLPLLHSEQPQSTQLRDPHHQGHASAIARAWTNARSFSSHHNSGERSVSALDCPPQRAQREPLHLHRACSHCFGLLRLQVVEGATGKRGTEDGC